MTESIIGGTNMVIEINNKRVEYLLKERFEYDSKEIEKFITNLILEEIEDEKFLTILKKSHMKNFASKEEVFKTLEQFDDSKI